ncbi:hypothetical protein EST38_g5019 [Candolleomyces aberdarensis]|uniref:Golgi apparatus membrane protein TVP38 n=1 Tax=Candolleomyces aberdarensis TaxID=2316362 RepID=A0A4Q2DNC5_9AGAR|nr:hypothetical protein EST38_g5019 [Candolleomyces aberdarensis]
MSGSGGHHTRQGSSTAVKVGLHGHSLNPTPYHHHHNTGNVTSREVVEAGNSDPRSDGLAGRTPSPTPSELRELKPAANGWGTSRERLWFFAAIIILIALIALAWIYDKQIVRTLAPAATWLHDTPGAFAIPMAVLIVISFPPLFGHAVVAILCGFVWGLGIGFGIVAGGTFLGEIGHFYASKLVFRTRGEKLERTNISHACLAQVVRDGGIRITLIARLSAIPAQTTTTVFSTCGVGIIIFAISTLLSMPKQALGVYLGVILLRSRFETRSSTERIVTSVVLAVTMLITAVATWYIGRQMDRTKPQVIYKRRKARQARLTQASSPTHPYLMAASGNGQSTMGSESTVMFNPSNDNLRDQNSRQAGSSQLALLPPVEAPQPRRPFP